MDILNESHYFDTERYIQMNKPHIKEQASFMTKHWGLKHICHSSYFIFSVSITFFSSYWLWKRAFFLPTDPWKVNTLKNLITSTIFIEKIWNFKQVEFKHAERWCQNFMWLSYRLFKLLNQWKHHWKLVDKQI